LLLLPAESLFGRNPRPDLYFWGNFVLPNCTSDSGASPEEYHFTVL